VAVTDPALIPPVVGPPAPAALAGAVAASRPRIAVVGEALLDGWLTGPAHRLGRDGPVPVVKVAASTSVPGGAANVAANLAALGADVELVTVLGEDADGLALRAAMAEHGVRTGRVVVEAGRATPAKRRIVASGQLVARYDSGPDAPLRPATEDALAAAVARACADADAVLVADYGLGTLTAAVRARIAELRGRIPLLVVDAHDLRPWAGLRPDAVAPNLAEAAALLGERVPGTQRVAWGVRQADALAAAAGGADVLLTVDTDGALYLPAGGTPVQRSSAHAEPESMACGAGDTFVAAWTASVSCGAVPAQALALAQAAADVVVSRPGTQVCGTNALTARLAATDRGRVLAHRDLAAALAAHRAEGRSVVFTNGCFDVLHRGHVAYLQQARALGDVLVVALNADESVARLKGPTRPVNPLEDRAGVVGALDAVDLVTAFHQDTPVELLELVRPAVYAKGGDYTPQMLPETPVVERLGGQVRVLDYLSDHSTSAIVAKIREEVR
jgi:D-beta-D-heptose 7-phosphate kinase / D-beta-D-heptose 1-phosphate adenosyltransferase